jgi:hypothetical protein
MTTGKARKAAIRQRMEQTGEPYNVARHAAEGQRASGDSHLIGDDETRRIAEGFLAASPWLGNVQWTEVPPSLFEAYSCYRPRYLHIRRQRSIRTDWQRPMSTA